MASAEVHKITYSTPFVHCLYVELVNSYCFHCLRQLAREKSTQLRCSNCKFATFCNVECQKSCRDQFHDFECPLIARCFPKAPASHAIFFARLLYRLENERIDIRAPYESRPTAPRTWRNLISHADAVKGNAQRMAKFETLKNLLIDYFKDAPGHVPRYSDEDLFVVYCKKAVNSHGIFNQYGDCIGESLDLDASIYDHSCRPNLSITYDGVAITFSLLNKNIKDPAAALRDPTRVFVSYVELALSRNRRRRLLKERYFFNCQCQRCVDLEDDQMTSIRCANPKCDQPLIGITEDGVPVSVTCPVCRTVRASSDVRQCQIMMRVVEKLTEHWREASSNGSELSKTADDIFKKTLAMFERCKPYLHDTNLYLTDLRLTYVFWAMKSKRNLDVALSMALESVKCVRLCYPTQHKLLGFHLLKIVYLHVATDEDYESARPHLEEAQEIMRRWFGEEHHICQKLNALREKFTDVLYLGKNVDKQEILSMMKFY